MSHQKRVPAVTQYPPDATNASAFGLLHVPSLPFLGAAALTLGSFLSEAQAEPPSAPAENSPPPAASAKDFQPDIHALLKQLDSNKFALREYAEKALSQKPIWSQSDIQALTDTCTMSSLEAQVRSANILLELTSPDIRTHLRSSIQNRIRKNPDTVLCHHELTEVLITHMPGYVHGIFGDPDSQYFLRMSSAGHDVDQLIKDHTLHFLGSHRTETTFEQRIDSAFAAFDNLLEQSKPFKRYLHDFRELGIPLNNEEAEFPNVEDFLKGQALFTARGDEKFLAWTETLLDALLDYTRASKNTGVSEEELRTCLEHRAEKVHALLKEFSYCAEYSESTDGLLNLEHFMKNFSVLTGISEASLKNELLTGIRDPEPERFELTRERMTIMMKCVKISHSETYLASRPVRRAISDILFAYEAGSPDKFETAMNYLGACDKLYKNSLDLNAKYTSALLDEVYTALGKDDKQTIKKLEIALKAITSAAKMDIHEQSDAFPSELLDRYLSGQEDHALTLLTKYNSISEKLLWLTFPDEGALKERFLAATLSKAKLENGVELVDEMYSFLIELHKTDTVCDAEATKQALSEFLRQK